MIRPALTAAGRFAQRRLARGAPYGLGVTLAFMAVAGGIWGFAEVIDALTEGDDLARFDADAHRFVFDLFGANPTLGEAVTWFGNNNTIVVLVVLVTAGLALTKRYWSAFRVAFASATGGLVVLGLKSFFQRARPLDTLIEAHGYSFPSGHAFASTVFYGMMVYVVWRVTDRVWARALAAVLGPLAFLAVGLSRVYLNVHYLTDVVAGWLAGGAWLVASLLIVHLVETRSRSGAEQREERERPSDAEPAA